MQTFLPYPDLVDSIRCLDSRRLGKQRVEAWQILKALSNLSSGKTSGWQNHPAIKMWRGYGPFLAKYYNACIDEWVYRGYDNNMPKIVIIAEFGQKPPPWFGCKYFHSAHRANLIRKKPDWYKQFGWPEKPMEGYFWPPEEQRNESC